MEKKSSSCPETEVDDDHMNIHNQTTETQQKVFETDSLDADSLGTDQDRNSKKHITFLFTIFLNCFVLYYYFLSNWQKSVNFTVAFECIILF